MAFSKTSFVDNQTVIDADTLNAIQDELIRVAGLLGKDIQSAAINDSGHLILTLTDGTELDAGVAKGTQGPKATRAPPVRRAPPDRQALTPESRKRISRLPWDTSPLTPASICP